MSLFTALFYFQPVNGFCRVVMLSFVFDFFLHALLIPVSFGVVWRLRLVRGVCACADRVCGGVCVTVRPRRPGGYTRMLAAVAPWPSSALGSVEVTPLTMSLLAVTMYRSFPLSLRVSAAACCRRDEGVSSLTIICCCRS